MPVDKNNNHEEHADQNKTNNNNSYRDERGTESFLPDFDKLPNLEDQQNRSAHF